VFAAGYSQGGHAAFAAADLQSEYAPEVPLTGVIGFGSTNDVTTLLKEGPCYAPYILHTYAELYGSAEIDPGEYLQASWASSLDDDVNRMCVDQFQSYYPANAQRLYRPEFYRSLYGGTLPRDYPRLHARLAENSSGLAGHRLPALMVQGLDDSVITTPSQNRFVRELSVAGSPVRYVRLAGVRHRNTRAAGFRLSVEWMEGLARGEPPVSDWTLADP
jgi:pimeloyl-ACP methyl ester carboxylesterase